MVRSSAAKTGASPAERQVKWRGRAGRGRTTTGSSRAASARRCRDNPSTPGVGRPSGKCLRHDGGQRAALGGKLVEGGRGAETALNLRDLDLMIRSYGMIARCGVSSPSGSPSARRPDMSKSG